MFRTGRGRTTWTLDPWREFRRLENLMDTVFSGISRPGNSGGFPAVNVLTNGDEAMIKAEIPGVDPDDIDISVKGKSVTLRGTRKPEETGEGETYHRRERWYGNFSRTMELPYSIEAGKVEAKYQGGVLTVTLPRAEDDKPMKITVSSN